MTSERKTTEIDREKAMAELQDLVERAKSGDRSAVPRLREYLDRNPQLWRNSGSIAVQAQAAWINGTVGPDLHLRECMSKQINEMKAELCGDSPTPLEALLVERIVTCWLHLGYLEAREAQFPERSERWFKLRMERYAMAERQFRGAVNALVTVRQQAPKIKDDVGGPQAAPPAETNNQIPAEHQGETTAELPPQVNGRFNGSRVGHLLQPQPAGVPE